METRTRSKQREQDPQSCFTWNKLLRFATGENEKAQGIISRMNKQAKPTRHRGRPSLGDRRRFTVRMRADDAQRIRAAAAERGKTLSDILAEAAQAVISR